MGRWRYEKDDGTMVIVQCGCPQGACLCWLDKEDDTMHEISYDPNIKSPCSKCGTDCQESGKYFSEGGDAFYFCKVCSSALEKLEMTRPVFFFLRKDGHELIKSEVERNIVLSRMKRQGVVN